MGLITGWGRLLRADPKLEWIRQHDSEAARQRLIWAAIVSLVLMPFFVLPGRGQSLTSAIYLSLVTDLFSCLVFLALLLATALNLTRKSLIERPYIEVIAWILIGIALSQLGYSFAFQKIGSALIDPAAPPTSYGDMTNIADRDKAATVAFILACISGLWLILSTRGLTFPPRTYAVLVLLWIIGSVIDPNLTSHPSSVGAEALFGLLAVSINAERYRRGSVAYDAKCAAEQDQATQDVFLSSLLSSDLRERIRRNEQVADAYSNLTVLFADMVGFTALSRRVSPGHLVDVLNEIFAAGDEIAVECGIEKVKTIGDCYMAVAGGIASPERGSADAIKFAQRYLLKVEEVSERLDIPLALRVGIHTGPAVGGIIGTSRPAYDYWGDTVNLASRFESASGAGRILVSESTWLQTKRDFEFEEGQDIEVKGVGMVRSHFVGRSGPEKKIVTLLKRHQ